MNTVISMTTAQYISYLISAFGVGLSLGNLLWLNHRLPKERKKVREDKAPHRHAEREDR